MKPGGPPAAGLRMVDSADLASSYLSSQIPPNTADDQ